jgi:hypothetical protein
MAGRLAIAICRFCFPLSSLNSKTGIDPLDAISNYVRNVASQPRKGVGSAYGWITWANYPASLKSPWKKRKAWARVLPYATI